MIIRVSGFSGFFSAPRAPVNDEATTERYATVEAPVGDGCQKPGKPGNPDDHEKGLIR